MSNIEFQDDPAWEQLRAHGFDTHYVHIHGTNPRIVSPIITLEEALKGWFPKGTKVKWVDQHGWDWERQQARLLLMPELIYTVKLCKIGSSSSTYELEEVDGRWNSVMFEKAE